MSAPFTQYIERDQSQIIKAIADIKAAAVIKSDMGPSYTPVLITGGKTEFTSIFGSNIISRDIGKSSVITFLEDSNAPIWIVRVHSGAKHAGAVLRSFYSQTTGESSGMGAVYERDFYSKNNVRYMTELPSSIEEDYDFSQYVGAFKPEVKTPINLEQTTSLGFGLTNSILEVRSLTNLNSGKFTTNQFVEINGLRAYVNSVETSTITTNKVEYSAQLTSADFIGNVVKLSSDSYIGTASLKEATAGSGSFNQLEIKLNADDKGNFPTYGIDVYKLVGKINFNNAYTNFTDVTYKANTGVLTFTLDANFTTSDVTTFILPRLVINPANTIGNTIVPATTKEYYTDSVLSVSDIILFTNGANYQVVSVTTVNLTVPYSFLTTVKLSEVIYSNDPITVVYDIEEEVPADIAAFTIVAASEGIHGNVLSTRIVPSKTEDDVFDLIVERFEGTKVIPDPLNPYKTKKVETFTELESFTVSKTKKLDGNGKQMYIENKINGISKYIKVIDNTAVELINFRSVPEGTVIRLFLSKGLNEPEVIDYTNSTATVYDDAVTVAHFLRGLSLISNPDLYEYTILLSSGLTHPSYIQAISALSERRIGTFSIAGVDPTAELQGVTAIVKSVDTYNTQSSYLAVYSPNIMVTDTDTNSELLVPVEGKIGAVFVKTWEQFDPWQAPAGFTRGQIDAISLNTTFDKEQMDYLYGNNINPIRTVPGFGFVIWGQKTRYGIDSALDRVNVRMLTIASMPRVLRYLDRYATFEFNSDATRSAIKVSLDNMWSVIKTKNGVYDFLVVCDKTNNPDSVIDVNELYVDLYIKPTKAVEFIKFRTTITKTGANLTSIAAGNA